MKLPSPSHSPCGSQAGALLERPVSSRPRHIPRRTAPSDDEERPPGVIQGFASRQILQNDGAELHLRRHPCRPRRAERLRADADADVERGGGVTASAWMRSSYAVRSWTLQGDRWRVEHGSPALQHT